MPLNQIFTSSNSDMFPKVEKCNSLEKSKETIYCGISFLLLLQIKLL